MKKLFTKPFKKEAPPPPKPPSTLPQTTHAIPALQPKFTLPPVPHPCPHEYLAILPSHDGLLLRPHLPKGVLPESHVRIAWGKEGLIEEIHTDGEGDGLDWSESVIVYGILGIITLFTASHLLVISGRDEVGHVLDPSQEVFIVKGVAVVPLVEGRARDALTLLAARQSVNPRLSLIPGGAVSARGSVDDVPSDTGAKDPAAPRVTFAQEEQVKVLTPATAHGFDGAPDEDAAPSGASSPSDSALSTPSSEYSIVTGNIAKTLADRLSFWNKMSRRQSATGINQALAASASAESSPSPSGSRRASVDERTSLDAIIKKGDREPSEVLESIVNQQTSSPTTVEQKNTELEEKILREIIHQFAKGGMYFAYRFDITRSVQQKQEMIAKSKKQSTLLADLNALDEQLKLSPDDGKVHVLAEPSATLPLWRRVDRQYWWNEWLSKPLLDAGLHTFVLPIMQGYFQIAHFPIPREPEASEEGDVAVVDYVLISRRSRDRAGLRYQRRGIDDDANVANFVETETIMRVEREGMQNVFSHLQIRGSIPLFWSQPGYSLKPAPVLSPDRTHEQNVDALKRHLQRLLQRYGPLSIVNLAEQHGKESVVTNAYRDFVHELALKDVQYTDYDFHTETKGMKYENISKLIDQMQRTFEGQGYLWISNDLIMSQQKGVFRVNCIDCLDRTNVVESAFARHVLNRQLGAVALQQPSDGSRSETDVVFNDVWANNGDAISREYAGTSALKGDFTRTGKRDLGGMLNDGVNSLARMYTSTFSDWFGQAVIDYMLGNRTISVFSEFLLKLQSSDPKDLIRISRIRAEAIADCVSRVLAEGERLLSGWTLFAPADMNVKIADKFEEKVLLLTVRAIYIISYDYTLEKVKMYTRVPLRDIVSITKGVYILSPLEEGSRDPLQNYGFVITWRNTRQDTRVTSYSIGNNIDFASPPSSPGFVSTPQLPERPSSPRPRARRTNTLSTILSKAAAPVLSADTSFAAFKALPIDPARSRRENGSFFEPADELTGVANCKEAVDVMVDTVARACAEAGSAKGELITQEDVVSLAEAQRNTSVYAKMEYGVKRLLWLGG
ncbi:SacI homology domain-containing protein [Phanerochaete sordida]|uniref:SacI homology domain-containing protein n=1 Tax=Phanerochaete sordida TaxID=48140 RepID=A0A9P3GAF7_9APHY|nr:SacI homology domain-containing protein [Phanerochaete sordida]